MCHIADDCLSALVHRDVLDPNGLITSAPVSLECLYLRRKRPGELIARTLGAILLRDSLHVPETKRECHGCHVNDCHLCREREPTTEVDSLNVKTTRS
jgi:hypothetical protein